MCCPFMMGYVGPLSLPLMLLLLSLLLHLVCVCDTLSLFRCSCIITYLLISSSASSVFCFTYQSSLHGFLFSLYLA